MDKKLCHGCKELTDPSHKCFSDHFICKECAECELFEKKCRCGDNLRLVRRCQEQDTANKTSGKCCKYQIRGCTWVFDQAHLLFHSEECRYRPYQCIGRTMNVWNCKWEGSKFEVDEHLKRHHKSAINIFTYQEENISYHFDMAELFYKKIDVIEAFNKTFILFYQFDQRTKLIMFMIYLLGTRQEANKYLYEFEILSDNVNKKIKIKHPCFNDVPVLDLMRKGKCILLPYQMIQNYLRENTIRIRFRMGRQDN